MKIKSDFKTRKEGVEYLKKRGWKFDRYNFDGEAVLMHGRRFRYVEKIKKGRWVIRCTA